MPPIGMGEPAKREDPDRSPSEAGTRLGLPFSDHEGTGSSARMARAPAAAGPDAAGTVTVEPHYVPPAANGSPDLIGEILAGTYRIERLIATGGMGAVYEVRHLRLDQPFAVKFLDRGLADDREAYARFKQEATIAAGLDHESVVQVFDFNTDSYGNPYMIMELVTGTTLDELLDRHGTFERDRLLGIFRPLCLALDECHRHGIVHRDLKPSNIMVSEGSQGQWRVKLLDFGISKIKHEGQKTMTRDNVVMGTPNYMSPEQAAGQNSEVDARADVFALGAILYEMLSGRRAFSGEGLPQLLHSIVYENPPSLSEVAPRVPGTVVEVTERCMAKKAAERFDSASELLKAIDTAWAPRKKSRKRRSESSRATSSTPAAPRKKAGWVWPLAWTASLLAAGAGGFLASGPNAAVAEIARSNAPAPTDVVAPAPVAEPVAAPYRASLAGPGAKVLEHQAQLYRADGSGLSYWGAPEAEPLKAVLPTLAAVRSLAMSVDGTELVVGQADGTVSRWERTLKKPVWSGRIGKRPIDAVASGHGYLVVASGKSLRLLNASTGKPLKSFQLASAPSRVFLTDGAEPMLIAVRPDGVSIVDTNRRALVSEVGLGGEVLGGGEADSLDGTPRIWVDFAHGDWRIRRIYAVVRPTKKAPPRLDLVDQMRVDVPG